MRFGFVEGFQGTMTIDITPKVYNSLQTCVRRLGRSAATDVLLTYGERPDGRLIHIFDVPSGLKCGCKCPSCETPLVAKKGCVNEYHFAHYGSSTCQHALETTIHKLAKQVIEDQRRVWLPEVRAVVGDKERILHRGRLFDVTGVVLEQWLDGMRPDIVARKGDHELLIEVAVTHFCDDRKKALIRARGIAAVEIDLREVPRDASKADIENAIMSAAPRKWLYNRLLDDAIAEMTEELDRRIADEAVRKQRKLDQEATPLLNVFRTRSPRDIAGKALHAAAQKIAEIRETELASAVGIDVGGGGCFVVDGKCWQTIILHHIVHKSWSGHPMIAKDVVTVLNDSSLMKAGMTGFIRQELADAVRLTEPSFLSPYEAVTAYLEWLSERTILTRHRTNSWMTETKAVVTARAAIKETEKVHQRIARVQNALMSFLEAVPDITHVSPEVWMERPCTHGGMSPRKLAELGDTDGLVDHLKRLRDMVRGHGSVEEDLLGLPLHAMRESRRNVIASEVRLREERKREKAEQERLAVAELARINAKNLRERVISEAYSVLGSDEGVKFINQPQECLGNRSLQQVEALEPSHEIIVRDAIDALGRRLQRQSAEACLIADNREKLQRAAEDALGATEKANLWMKSGGHPSLMGKRPIEIAVNEDGLRRCLTLLAKLKK